MFACIDSINGKTASLEHGRGASARYSAREQPPSDLFCRAGLSVVLRRKCEPDPISSAADYLDGGAGNDTLQGSDELFGGAGNDELITQALVTAGRARLLTGGHASYLGA